jgi:hypothetical protein
MKDLWQALKELWATYSDALNVGLFFVGLQCVGLILIFVGVSQAPTGSYSALLWALACSIFGGTLGFLFGIPRVVQTGEQDAAGTSGLSQTAAQTPAYQQQVNTGLERVSEWLTTMLVGVGLTQLGSLADHLKQAAEAIAPAFGGAANGRTFAGALIVFFSASGFLGSYMMTRLFIASAFGRADTRPIGSVSERANLTMEETIALDNSIIGIGERPNILSGTAQLAAKKILALPFNSLKTGYDFGLWGKAQVNEKSFKEATEAYERASALAPYDVKIQFEYATALFYSGAAFNAVRPQLMTAYRGIRPETSSDLIKDIYKGLTYHALCQDGSVAGFSEAIKFGEEYVANRKSLPSASIWLNLACAYGQKMSWLRANPSERITTVLTNDQEQSQTLTQAINAVQQALLLDATSKTKLQKLLEGTDPNDNDLVVFKEDKDFRNATGL